MAKFFSGEMPLPFPTVQLLSTEVSPDKIKEILSGKSEVTICVSFAGYDDNCLGFIFNVRKTEDRFQLLNIAMQIEVMATNARSLSKIIKHVAGIEYDESVHAVFQSSRNNIGHAEPPVHFVDAAEIQTATVK